MLPHPPRYLHHTGPDQAYVRLDGRQVYLGKWNSPESRERYDQIVLQWRKKHDVTGKYTLALGQLCLLFCEHAEAYYRRPDGADNPAVYR